MSAFTPGPWSVSNAQGGVFQHDIVGPCGEDIAYANASNGADDLEVYPVAANARLIAAAPDLLEALRQIAKGEGAFSRDPLTHASNVIDEMKALAIAAIAKAEGA